MIRAICQRVSIIASLLAILGLYIATSKPSDELQSIGEILLFSFSLVGVLFSVSFIDNKQI